MKFRLRFRPEIDPLASIWNEEAAPRIAVPNNYGDGTHWEPVYWQMDDEGALRSDARPGPGTTPAVAPDGTVWLTGEQLGGPGHARWLACRLLEAATLSEQRITGRLVAPASEQYVIWTRYVTARGQVIRHAYGPYATRSKATTAKKHMMREAALHYSTDEIARAEVSVVKLLADS